MKDIGLKESLMDKARQSGICIDGFRKMHSGSMDEMLDYYISNPDWCLERGFPDIETLEEEFGDCEGKGIFVGRHFNGELLNDLQTYVFHKCTGIVKVALNIDKAIIPMLYVANGCNLRILGVGAVKSNGPVSVPVYEFGRNNVTANDNEYVRFVRHNNSLI